MQTVYQNQEEIQTQLQVYFFRAPSLWDIHPRMPCLLDESH